MKDSEIYNEHLNIFNYYGRGKTCEDNLSRILARILIEENYKKFQKELLELIGINGSINNVFSHVSVRHIKRYINENNIEIIDCIPVTLTSKEKKIDEESLLTKLNIPDIVIQINNKLVFIEVKLTGTIPKKQVLNQVNEYLENDKKNNVIQIYWEDIIRYLSKLYKNDFFIRDYLQLIAKSYPEWFEYSFKDLYLIMKKDKNNNIIYKEDIDLKDKGNLINVKISRIIEKYCKDNNIRLHPDFSKRRAFPLYNKFTSEMQLRFKQKDNRLESHIWTGELVEYSKNFNDYYKNNKELIQEFLNINNNKFKANCYIIPYVLFRDHFGYLSSIDYNNLKNKFIPDKITNILCGRKKYNEFEKIINENKNEIQKTINNFQEEFNKIGEKFYSNTKRTNITILIGYDIVISYPQEIYFKLDEENKMDFIIDDSLKLYKKYFKTEINY